MSSFTESCLTIRDLNISFVLSKRPHVSSLGLVHYMVGIGQERAVPGPQHGFAVLSPLCAAQNQPYLPTNTGTEVLYGSIEQLQEEQWAEDNCSPCDALAVAATSAKFTRSRLSRRSLTKFFGCNIPATVDLPVPFETADYAATSSATEVKKPVSVAVHDVKQKYCELNMHHGGEQR